MVPAVNLVLVTIGGGFALDGAVRYLQAAIRHRENPLSANPAGISPLEAAGTILGLLSGFRFEYRDFGRIGVYDVYAKKQDSLSVVLAVVVLQLMRAAVS